MSKISSQDRSALIRLASSLPAGNQTRKAILAGLVEPSDASLKQELETLFQPLGLGKFSGQQPRPGQSFRFVTELPAQPRWNKPLQDPRTDLFVNIGSDLSADLQAFFSYTLGGKIFSEGDPTKFQFDLKDPSSAKSALSQIVSAIQNLQDHYSGGRLEKILNQLLESLASMNGAPRDHYKAKAQSYKVRLLALIELSLRNGVAFSPSEIATIGTSQDAWIRRGNPEGKKILSILQKIWDDTGL